MSFRVDTHPLQLGQRPCIHAPEMPRVFSSQQYRCCLVLLKQRPQQAYPTCNQHHANTFPNSDYFTPFFNVEY